jgi:prevent-host-death family protein
MCYMADVAKVGIREIRQNLSVYLDRVKLGEAIEITERGHPVALLQPLPRVEGVLQRLVAQGRARPAVRPHRDLPPLVIPPRGAPSSGEVLDEERADRV